MACKGERAYLMAKAQVIITINNCLKCPSCCAADKGAYCSQLKNYITPKDGEIPDSCPQPDWDTVKHKLGIGKHAA